MIGFDIKDFKMLAKFHKPHCVSIFIPTHRAGEEVNEGLDWGRLKNQLQNAEKELKEYQMSDNEIEKFLAPAYELLEEPKFWKYQSDGLAIFISKDLFRKYTLPVHFEEFLYVADHFYLKPLVPLFNAGGEFYILALSQQEVRLFQGFPYQLNEIEVESLLPERLEETVGYDFKQKYLQFREGQTWSNKTMFHGHGEGKDDQKEEILKFFRAIDEGVTGFLRDSKAPLILAAVDFLVPIYREANNYKYLHDEHIAGNPEEADLMLLHEKAMDILHDKFEEEKREKMERFEYELSQVKASYDEGEVIPAAINGRVDTLFIRNRSSLWGTFKKETNTIEIDGESTIYNADLLNIAAIDTLLQNGSVYLLDKEEMPAPTGKANAILRF